MGGVEISSSEQINRLKNQIWVYDGNENAIIGVKEKIHEMFINNQIKALVYNNEINGYYKSFEVFEYEGGHRELKLAGNTLIGLFRFCLGIATLGMTESLTQRIYMNVTLQRLKDAVGTGEDSTLEKVDIQVKSIDEKYNKTAKKMISIMIRTMDFMKFLSFAAYVVPLVVLDSLEAGLLYVACKRNGIQDVRFVIGNQVTQFKGPHHYTIGLFSSNESVGFDEIIRKEFINDKKKVGERLNEADITSTFGIKDLRAQDLITIEKVALSGDTGH